MEESDKRGMQVDRVGVPKGTRVRILDGATYGQDFQFHVWKRGANDPTFTVTGKLSENGRLKLVAPGFGDLEGGNYGNGAIYIYPDGVTMDEQDEQEVVVVPHRAKGYRLVVTCPHCKRELEIEQVKMEITSWR